MQFTRTLSDQVMIICFFLGPLVELYGRLGVNIQTLFSQYPAYPHDGNSYYQYSHRPEFCVTCTFSLVEQAVCTPPSSGTPKDDCLFDLKVSGNSLVAAETKNFRLAGETARIHLGMKFICIHHL